MNENLFQTQYDVTKKSKFRKFYDEKKYLIFSFLFFIVLGIASISFYIENKEKKKTVLADSYIEAKIYLENGEINKSKDILEKIIYSNDSTYSTLALFLMLSENFLQEDKDISKLFDHVLENNKFEKEIRNLITFKKALIETKFLNESELLKTLNPLMNTDTLWKPHALLLLGDYFFFKKEYLKANEFYVQILTMKGLHEEIYKQARSQLALISND